jgi:hypothetical protein
MARKRDTTVQVGLRLKEPLRKRVERAAKSNGVSMNAELVRRLEESFAQRGVVHELFGGQANLLLAQMVCRHLNTIHPDIMFDDWAFDEDKFKVVRAHFEKHGGAAIVKMLDYIVEDQTGFKRNAKIEPLPRFRAKDR